MVVLSGDLVVTGAYIGLALRTRGCRRCTPIKTGKQGLTVDASTQIGKVLYWRGATVRPIVYPAKIKPRPPHSKSLTTIRSWIGYACSQLLAFWGQAQHLSKPIPSQHISPSLVRAWA